MNIFLLISILIFIVSCRQPSRHQYTGWPQYKGSDENIQYSSLTQIDTGNVQSLKIAWTYHTGDADTANHSQIQCNPIIVNNILYGTSPQMKLFAVDAVTGAQKWVFNPFDSLASDKRSFFIMNNSRGVTYYADKDNGERVFYTAGPYLYCINATTGHTIQSFGDSGKIDLHDGLDRDVKDFFVTATSPGIIYKDKIIMGSRVDEGARAAPGHIRAFDVFTGKREWIFHTIPQPGEKGYDTWDDTAAYKIIGGANAWSGFSLDKERGIVFAATGSASYDWYGGKRTGNNLFANCLLALNASTGKLKWHYQNVHHDVWDRDFSSAPALVTINKSGKNIEALAITTKMGYVLVFDRETGNSIYPILEQPVPGSSDLVGEKISPTQPLPSRPAPFSRQIFMEKDINPLLSATSYQDVRTRLLSYKNDHPFNPISLQGTVVFPGLDGGAEWGGPSYDPLTGILYINANEMAWVIQAVAVKEKTDLTETYLQAGKRLYQANCMQCHGPERKGSGNNPSLINVQKKYSTQSFDTLIQSGRRMMPAFKQLRQNEREALAAFILNFSSHKNRPYKDSSKENDIYKMPYTITGYNRFLSTEGFPAIAPPWGTLNAINLNSGEFVWKTTLGTDPAFPRAKEPTGSENYGGSVVTAGGLLFIAATKDGKLRAFNKSTGKVLWQTGLPSPAFSTPSIYLANGKQYVVIACGGGKLNTLSGDSYIAFALP